MIAYEYIQFGNINNLTDDTKAYLQENLDLGKPSSKPKAYLRDNWDRAYYFFLTRNIDHCIKKTFIQGRYSSLKDFITKNWCSLKVKKSDIKVGLDSISFKAFNQLYGQMDCLDYRTKLCDIDFDLVQAVLDNFWITNYTRILKQ